MTEFLKLIGGLVLIGIALIGIAFGISRLSEKPSTISETNQNGSNICWKELTESYGKALLVEICNKDKKISFGQSVILRKQTSYSAEEAQKMTEKAERDFAEWQELYKQRQEASYSAERIKCKKEITSYKITAERFIRCKNLLDSN